MEIHITRDVNKLDDAKRIRILSMPVEGSSMNSIARVTYVGPSTVAKLLLEAGRHTKRQNLNFRMGMAALPG